MIHFLACRRGESAAAIASRLLSGFINKISFDVFGSGPDARAVS